MDLWPWTLAARRSLLATFEELDDDQWSVPSLSDAWTVRDVLAHLILATRPPARRYVAALARARGSFDRANHALAVADSQKPIATLLAEYRSVLEHRFSPPGWPPAAPLCDILVHSLDVRIALDLPAEQPPEHYEPAMRLLFGPFGRSFTRSGRPAIQWRATDREWAHGEGPSVSGTIADLALTAAGRDARVDHLSGDGVGPLRSWLS